jgi:hypothetical protein
MAFGKLIVAVGSGIEKYMTNDIPYSFLRSFFFFFCIYNHLQRLSPAYLLQVPVSAVQQLPLPDRLPGTGLVPRAQY